MKFSALASSGFLEEKGLFLLYSRSLPTGPGRLPPHAAGRELVRGVRLGGSPESWEEPWDSQRARWGQRGACRARGPRRAASGTATANF